MDTNTNRTEVVTERVHTYRNTCHTLTRVVVQRKIVPEVVDGADVVGLFQNTGRGRPSSALSGMKRAAQCSFPISYLLFVVTTVTSHKSPVLFVHVYTSSSHVFVVYSWLTESYNCTALVPRLSIHSCF